MRIGCVWETLACLTAAIMVLNSCTTAAGEVTTCSGIVPMVYRNDKISITDFGGIGDGRTLNTKAFNEAIYRIKHLRRRGGTLLYIPPGVYLTQSFNLTSRMTLYLAKGARSSRIHQSKVCFRNLPMRLMKLPLCSLFSLWWREEVTIFSRSNMNFGTNSSSLSWWWWWWRPYLCLNSSHSVGTLSPNAFGSKV